MRRIALLLAFALALVSCTNGDGPSADAVSPSDSSTDSLQDRDSTNSDSADSKNGGGGPTGLHPRFVLYDADGNPVKAKFVVPNPRDVSPGEKFDPTAKEWVGIEALNQRVLLVSPRLYLESGELRGYYKNDDPRIRFLDNNCSGQAYLPYSGSSPVGGYEGPLKWAKGTVKSVEQQDLYHYGRESGKCEVLYPDQTDKQKIYPLKPVPKWLSNAFDNPPYTVKVKY